MPALGLQPLAEERQNNKQREWKENTKVFQHQHPINITLNYSHQHLCAEQTSPIWRLPTPKGNFHSTGARSSKRQDTLGPQKAFS